MNRWLSGILLMLCSFWLHAEIRVIELHHRTEHELLPVLRPLLQNTERASGQGNQLVIQASSRRLNELQGVITRLDTPLRRLLITLDSSGNQITDGQDIAIHGRFGGRQGELVVGQPENGNRVHIRRYSSGSDSQNNRSVQTLEGSAAFIATGQEISRQHWSHDHRGRPVKRTEQQKLQQGLYVLPRIQGDQVTLEVSTTNDQLASHNHQQVERQSLATRISGPLGQWLELGGINHYNNQNGRDTLSTSKTYSTENNRLRIKVELLAE